MTNVRLKLAPPWVTYVNEIKALFGEDPDIVIKYDNDNVELKLYVEDFVKAAALGMLLPEEKEFGNVTLFITIVPANGKALEHDFTSMTYGQIFDTVFKGNPVYSFSVDIDSVFSNVLTYVVFKNKVVQFFNDNLNDVYGNMSTLYQEIASDVFNIGRSVFFCTDKPEELGKSLTEWP